MKHLLLVFIAFALSAHAQEVILSSDFEDEGTVNADWEVKGSSPNMAIISTEKAASGKQSLAIVDKVSNKHAAWQTKVIDLPQGAIDKGQISVSWKILHSIPDGHVMRFTIDFVGENEDQNTKHFSFKGDSEGWSSGTFTEQRYDVPISSDSTKIRLKLGSYSEKGGVGEVYLDDLKIEY